MKHASILFSFLLQLLQFLITMCLLLGLFYKVFDSFALHDFVDTKDFVEIFLQLFTSFFDIFWTLVGDSEDFLLGELRSKRLKKSYRFFILLSIRASWTFLSSLYLVLKVHSS